VTCDITEGWPPSSDIDVLCEKAAGLFIYASTAIKFVTSPRIMSPRRGSLSSSPFHITLLTKGESGIDSLYTEILRHAYHNMWAQTTRQPGSLLRRFRSVVGAVLLAFNPLSMKSLSDLLHDFDTPSEYLHCLELSPFSSPCPEVCRRLHLCFPQIIP
jgi:hypothetical protein